VQAVIDDWRTAPVSDKVRSVLGFLEKLTLTPETVGPADMEPMRQVGVTDQEIEDAIAICFLFNVITRLADAFDFEIVTENINTGAKMLYQRGYGVSSIPW
jgi:alkylhydroperoxidase family enzyme